MSQTEQILKHLQSGKTLTNADAVALCDCYRLSGRIKDLRDRGFEILRKDVPNKNGIGTHGVYYMEAKNEKSDH